MSGLEYPSDKSYNGLSPYDPTGKAPNTAQITVNAFGGKNEMLARKFNEREGGGTYYKKANYPNAFDIHPRRLCFARKDDRNGSQLEVLTALNGAGRPKDKVYQIENDYWLVGYAGGDGVKFLGDDPKNSTNDRPSVQIAVVTTGPASIIHTGKEHIRAGDYLYWAFPEDPEGNTIKNQRESTIYPELRVYKPQWDTEGLRKLASVVFDIPKIKCKPDLIPIEEGAVRFEKSIRVFMALGAYLYHTSLSPDEEKGTILKTILQIFNLDEEKNGKDTMQTNCARNVLFGESTLKDKGQFQSTDRRKIERLLKCAVPDCIWSVLQMDQDTRRKIIGPALKPAFPGDEFDVLFTQ